MLRRSKQNFQRHSSILIFGPKTPLRPKNEPKSKSSYDAENFAQNASTSIFLCLIKLARSYDLFIWWNCEKLDFSKSRLKGNH